MAQRGRVAVNVHDLSRLNISFHLFVGSPRRNLCPFITLSKGQALKLDFPVLCVRVWCLRAIVQQ